MYYRSDSTSSRLTVDNIDESAVAAAKVVHLTGITTAISRSAREAVFACMEIARAKLVSWDLNYRSALCVSGRRGAGAARRRREVRHRC